MANLFIRASFPVPATGAAGSTVTLSSLLTAAFGDNAQFINSARFGYYDATSLALDDSRYWVSSGGTVSQWRLNGTPMTPTSTNGSLTVTTVQKANFGNVDVLLGNQIDQQLYFQVRIDDGSTADATYVNYAVESMSFTTPTLTGHAPTAAQLVAKAQEIAAAYPALENTNDCHTIAAAIAASVGAQLAPGTNALTPATNQESGFWRIVHRGSDTAVQNWQTLVQPGDIVRFDWADPLLTQHTTLVTGAINANGQITVVDNLDKRAGIHYIGQHLARFDVAADGTTPVSVATSVTIYRLTTDDLSLVTTTAANEQVFGTTLNDKINAGLGNDNIRAGDGNDRIVAATSDGNDTITGGAGFDVLDFSGVGGVVQVNQFAGTVTGSAGNDTLLDVIEQIVGSNFDDVLAGGNGINVLDGNGGHDKLYGNGGQDLLHGGDGSDTFYASANDGDDTLLGGAGFDVLDYSTLTGVVQVNQFAGTTTGSANNDTLSDVFEQVIGSAFGDVLAGGNGINGLIGGGGNDSLFGNGGQDYLRGGTGNDEITMGTGDDTLDMRVGDQLETIMDFVAGGAEDSVNLHNYGLAGITTFAQLQASGRLATVSGHAELTLNGGDKIIFQNVASHTSLTAADFTF